MTSAKSAPSLSFLQMTKMRRRAPGCQARKFPLYHTPANLSIGKLHKLSAIFYPGIVYFSQIEKNQKNFSNFY